ncbi:MAG TPA: formimidoylglutamate deiminase [Thermoanaerobaculia bacterium]|nr:formimidoylglutamate deiminase [Thermoanaerobaculia bacterium]
MTRILEADLTWTGERFEAGIRITIGDDGRIASIATQDADATHAEIPVERLRGRALLPGFVNGHSHAFQRGLRGLGERFPAGAGNFWTWREAMYDLVERMDEERIHTLSLQAFREMRAAGVTTVGEFHYLHHRGPGADFAFDEAILAAAEAAGIRLVLLETYYQTGGIGLPLGPAQRRFEGVSPGVYWRQVDALEAKLGPRQSLGGVVHSVRAAGLDELAEIYVETRRRGLPFHIHVEEQVKEVEDCRAAYGKTPMAAVLDACGGAEGMTAIHCTHTEPDDLDRFFATGGTACLCPTTEGNLGDGHPGLARVGGDRARLCLGSDSNARISFLEEMRWLEYGQRLATETRGALRDRSGRLAPVLLRAATLGGANALGIPAGEIAPGRHADFVAIDLNAPSLAGWQPETLPESLIFGAGEEAIAGTWVGGRG